MAKKLNYLNNRDLLLEIHKSKKSFCVYRDIITDSDYDIILPDMSFFSSTPIYSTYEDVIEKKTELANNLIKERYQKDIVNDPNADHMDLASALDEIGILDEYHETIHIAKKNRADRIARKQYKKVELTDTTAKLSQFAIDPDTYTLTDIVFRVTTWDHIPFAPAKTKKKIIHRRKKTSLNPIIIDEDEVEDIPPPVKYVIVNFPPWYHWRINDDNEVFQVAKSHWKGEYVDGDFVGKFDIYHGKITDKLVRMYIKLCDRLATKSNWRIYSYNDEMRGQALCQLAKVGLKFDEAKGNNPFAYYTTVVTHAFTGILNLEKRNQGMRDDILEANNFTPSFTRQVDNDIAIMESIESKRQAWNNEKLPEK